MMCEDGEHGMTFTGYDWRFREMDQETADRLYPPRYGTTVVTPVQRDLDRIEPVTTCQWHRPIGTRCSREATVQLGDRRYCGSHVTLAKQLERG